MNDSTAVSDTSWCKQKLGLCEILAELIKSVVAVMNSLLVPIASHFNSELAEHFPWQSLSARSWLN